MRKSLMIKKNYILKKSKKIFFKEITVTLQWCMSFIIILINFLQSIPRKTLTINNYK